MYEICPTFFLRSCQLQQTLRVLLLIYFQLFGGQSKTPPLGSSFLTSCCDMKVPPVPPCCLQTLCCSLLPIPPLTAFGITTSCSYCLLHLALLSVHHPAVLSPAVVSKRNHHVGEHTSLGLGRHLLVSDPFWLWHKQ